MERSQNNGLHQNSYLMWPHLSEMFPDHRVGLNSIMIFFFYFSNDQRKHLKNVLELFKILKCLQFNNKTTTFKYLTNISHFSFISNYYGKREDTQNQIISLRTGK